MRRKIKVECEEDLNKLDEIERQEFLRDIRVTNINASTKNIYFNIPAKWHPLLGLKKVGVMTVKLLQKKVVASLEKNEHGMWEIRLRLVDDEEEVVE